MSDSKTIHSPISWFISPGSLWWTPLSPCSLFLLTASPALMIALWDVFACIALGCATTWMVINDSFEAKMVGFKHGLSQGFDGGYNTGYASGTVQTARFAGLVNVLVEQGPPGVPGPALIVVEHHQSDAVKDVLDLLGEVGWSSRIARLPGSETPTGIIAWNPEACQVEPEKLAEATKHLIDSIHRMRCEDEASKS